jgi:hypothetical protein
MMQAEAPAASKIRAGGDAPYGAMLSRLTFNTANGVQLKAL